MADSPRFGTLNVPLYMVHLSPSTPQNPQKGFMTLVAAPTPTEAKIVAEGRWMRDGQPHRPATQAVPATMSQVADYRRRIDQLAGDGAAVHTEDRIFSQRLHHAEQTGIIELPAPAAPTVRPRPPMFDTATTLEVVKLFAATVYMLTVVGGPFWVGLGGQLAGWWTFRPLEIGIPLRVHWSGIVASGLAVLLALLMFVLHNDWYTDLSQPRRVDYAPPAFGGADVNGSGTARQIRKRG